MKITFLGASEMVTGSGYLVETERFKYLVDFGMFQGSAKETKRNHEPLLFDPSTIDFVILTHAHIDHSGRLPLLVKNGFKGKILMTKPTSRIAELLLLDSAFIQKQDLERENRKRNRSGDNLVEPLYSEDDVYDTIQYFYPISYNEKINMSGCEVEFFDAGHLLGAAFVKVRFQGKTITFSGDIGHEKSLLYGYPKQIGQTDYLVVETTYGDRLHSNLSKRVEDLFDEIISSISKGHTVIIPAFSVGRTQELLYALFTYAKQNSLEKEFIDIPIYIDSPLAIEATDVYLKFSDYLRSDVDRDNFIFDNLHILRSPSDSMALNFNSTPKVIISASGMCDAGRILHHLKHYLWKETTKIIFVGYQAEESLGRKILNKEPFVSILGEKIVNNAHIVSIEGFSGHGDQRDLLYWIRSANNIPSKTILVHGEQESLAKMSEILTTKEHSTYIPKVGDSLHLD